MPCQFATQQEATVDQCDPSSRAAQAAMSIDVRGDLPGLCSRTRSKCKYNVLPMPTIPNTVGKQVHPTGGGSVGWGLSPGAKHVKLALDFLHYLYSPAGYAAAEKTFGIVPAVRFAHQPERCVGALPKNPANNEAYAIAANSVQAIAPANSRDSVLGLADKHPERRSRRCSVVQASRSAMNNSPEARRMTAYAGA